MRRISNNPPKGLSRAAIRIWGLMFLVVGAVGHAILMNAMLGMSGALDLAKFESYMNSSSKNIALGVFAFLSQVAEACAIPIYAFLLVDGFRRTKGIRDYALRMAGVALLAEIPFNLAMSGRWLYLDSRNPMFAMVLGMAALYLFHNYSGRSIKNILIRLLVLVMSVLWVEILRIEDGLAIVVMICTLWGLRKNRSWQILGGCAMMFVVAAVPRMNPFYWVAPLVFLAVYFYNDEQGEENRWFNYLSYPAMLLIVGLIGKYAF